MNFLRLLKVIFFNWLLFCIVNTYADQPIKICLTGKIVEKLPTYAASFLNAAYLAREQNKLEKEVIIQTFFFNEQPLAPIESYKEMRKNNCTAIIGYEYLSDVLLVIKTQPDKKVPIFTSYPSTVTTFDPLPNNVFIFVPPYKFYAEKILDFLQKKYGTINKVLVVTEINRDSMREYKEAYLELLKKGTIKADTFDFLENDNQIDTKLGKYLKGRNYNYVILLSGAIASSKIADYMENKKTIFIGTENFGSSAQQSFYIRLENKDVHAYLIRNIDLVKADKALSQFEASYKAEFNSEPSMLGAYTYDATNIILKTFKETGTVSPANVRKINYKGVTGISISNNQFHRSYQYVILSVDSSGYHYAE